MIDRLPLLFAGMLAVRELGVLAQLVEAGLLDSPSRLPPHVADINARASWMAYSDLLNPIDLHQMETHLGSTLD